MPQYQMVNKTRLMLPEYGRNVQRMVRYLSTIEDRTLRNRQAEVVVGIMANLSPHRRDTEEFQHMLWDHLFMIADFNINIDPPFPRPTPDLFSPVPSRVPYNQGYISQKQYGRSIKRMAREIVQSDDSPQDKEAVAVNMAKFMRQKSYEYNNEFPSNEVVIADLNAISGGGINLDSDTLDNSRIEQNRTANPRTRSNQNNSGQNNPKKGQQHNRKYTKHK